MKKFLLLFLIIAFSISTKASHFQGGYIQYECLGDSMYKFTVFFYQDCDGIEPGNSVTLEVESSCTSDFSFDLPLIDDFLTLSEREVTDLSCGTSTCAGGSEQGTSLWKYEAIIKLPTYCLDWKFYYTSAARNGAITNLQNPQSNWYIDATLNNTGGICNSSPVQPGNTTPVPGLCAGNIWEYNFGAVDLDGDSLVYTLAVPQDYNGINIDYLYNPPFSADYPFETEQGIILFDSSTGYITAQPKYGLDQFAVVSVIIDEYRNGIKIGSVRRDIQVVTETNCQDADAAIGSNPIDENDVLNALYNPLDSSISACVNQEFSFNFTLTDTSLNPPPGYDITSNIKLLDYESGELITSVIGTTIFGTVIITVSPSDTGLQILEVTITNQTDTCFVESATFEFPINIVPGLVLDDPILGDSLIYCNNGDSITLPGNDAGRVTWFNLKGGGYPNGFSSDTINHPLAAPSETTQYLGVAEELTQCKNRDTITIIVLPLFDMPDTLDHCLDDSLIIAPTWMLDDSTANLFYTWLDGSEDSINFREEKTQTVDSSRYFGVTIEDKNSKCIVQDSMWVNFIECFLEIPNIFTPNGDGMNDLFEFKHFDPNLWDLVVYNRWGKQVFYESPYLNKWDGQDLPDGMYYYHLQHQELRLEYKGWMQISR